MVQPDDDDGSTTSTAVMEEERIEDEEFFSCGEDSPMEEESDGSTTSTAVIAEERMEESDNYSEEFFSCGEDSQSSSSSSCDSPWNFRYSPGYYRQWDGRHVMVYHEITDSDPPSSLSSLSRSSSMIENLDDSIKELSLELKKLFKVKDMVQTKLKKERKKHPVAMTVMDDVKSWFIHVDKSIKLGNRLLGPKFPMKLLLGSDLRRNKDAPEKKEVILELIKTFLELKNQAQDLLDRIARHPINEELRQLKVQTSYFSLKQIEVATDNFDKKIGHGVFGPVYKGVLQDGTIVSVKRLSPDSMQAEREIVNEIAMISTLQHRNIVKLLGCCIEGSELLIIYEYLKNTSLDRALLFESSRLSLDWQRRRKISLDIARGLAYLHEQSRLKIVHRNINGATILLDENMDAKISGFRLAKLYDEENTHIRTPVAGTHGYIAPEYINNGHLTEKADVYSYGVVLLEIISGNRCYQNYGPTNGFFYLPNWARVIRDRGNLLDLVDPSMDSNFSVPEAEILLNLAFLCTNDDPTLRPTMSSVVSMIEGRTPLMDLATSMDRFDS